MENLTVTLAGRPVLRGVNAAFESGALWGIVGPNGAGKTTLARALLGLAPAAEGRVLLDGREIAGLSRRDIARALAYLPQGHAVHWPLSVKRLVALGRTPHLGPLSRLSEKDSAAAARAMARTGVAELADRVALELSGGERARALLARALAAETPGLIVDEPLADLDPAHRLEIIALLQSEARAGRLVIAVLHDLDLAWRFCDRVLVLRDGEAVASGTPREALTAEVLAEVFRVRAYARDAAGECLVPWALTTADGPKASATQSLTGLQREP